MLHNIEGVDWEGFGRLSKNYDFSGEVVDVGLLGWVGKGGTLEFGNMSDDVSMDTEKATSKSGDVTSKVGDRF